MKNNRQFMKICTIEMYKNKDSVVRFLFNQIRLAKKIIELERKIFG